jgi:hypothetical protein
MRFARDAAVLTWLALAGMTAACQPERSEAAQAPTVPAPPGPSSALMSAIADGERASLAALPTGPGQADVQGSCVICHGTAMIQQQHKDSAGWAKTVNQMRTWGAPLAADKVPEVIAYLAKNYGLTGP